VPSPAWTKTDGSGNLASGWILQEVGSALRLSLLRLHIQEVSDRISNGNFQTEGTAHSYDFLQDYLESLSKKEVEEAALVSAGLGNRCSFTRGVPYGKGGA